MTDYDKMKIKNIVCFKGTLLHLFINDTHAKVVKLNFRNLNSNILDNSYS
jgi:hypothetical protein